MGAPGFNVRIERVRHSFGKGLPSLLAGQPFRPETKRHGRRSTEEVPFLVHAEPFGHLVL